jgi:hypothetical protein
MVMSGLKEGPEAKTGAVPMTVKAATSKRHLFGIAVFLSSPSR